MKALFSLAWCSLILSAGRAQVIPGFLGDGNSTDSLTMSPSINDTELSTEKPLYNETEAPSPSTAMESPVGAAPSAEPSSTVSVEGVVAFTLMDTPSLLIGSTEVDFLNAAGVFLRGKLVNNDNEEVPSIDVVQLGIVRQSRIQSRRRLFLAEQHARQVQSAPSSPLYVELRVVGRHQSQSEMSSTPLDFDEVLSMLFSTFKDDFLTTLQALSEDSYFDDMVDIAVVEREVTTSPSSQPVDSLSSPTFNDNVTPTTYGNFAEESTVDDNEVPWSIGVIVGVAAAGAVISILLLVVICRLSTGKSSSHEMLAEQPRLSPSGNSGAYRVDRVETTTSTISTDTPQNKKKWLAMASSYQASYEEEPATSSVGPLQEQVSDLESQGLYSYVKTDSDSYMGGSVMNSNSVMGMDNMSYAYSLEPGIEPSVVGTYQGDQSTFHEGSAVPMEIPQITVFAPNGKNGPDNERTARNNLSPSQGSASGSGINRTTEKERPLSPSDLKLTESELAMLPPNMRDEAEQLSRGPPSKVVVAPSGKLGIVIDTTVDGPVVHHVNDGSALKGKIFPGDIIVAIDDVDTRAMSASAITALMVKTANQKRRLTVVDSMKLATKKKKKGTKR